MKNNRVINFTKSRYLFFAVSLVLIAVGIAGMVIFSGFNLGIDFQAGLSQRLQISNSVMTVTYSGADDITLDVANRQVLVEIRNADGVVTRKFAFADHETIGDLAAALSETTDLNVSVLDGAARTEDISAGLSMPLELNMEPSFINTANADPNEYVTINEIREALSELPGSIQVQVVGDEMLQEFQVRVEAQAEGEKEQLEADISTLLKAEFGQNNVVVKQSNYVGPKFSNLLTYRSIIMVVVALALIMAYIWVRFQFASAVSAITALAHDILIMLGFIAIFRLEVTTTTIAALLTIIGYSLNDTIVVFDRIRENTSLLKGKTFERIVNTSITQSLSRTLITSITTLIAVIPLFIFATGAIRLFALNLIVGIVVGTYSSIFVASPVLLGLTNRSLKRKARHLGKDPVTILAEEADSSGEKSTPAAVRQEIDIPTATRKLKGKRGKRK